MGSNTDIYASFLHAFSSRDPLSCSKEQLTYILDHFQVMPTFLEHVFTFCYREDPHLQASFRSEDHLNQHSISPSPAPSLNDGLRIQHCFNLVGLEYEQASDRGPGSFKYRQTAAYYTLDLATGQSTWIMIKANKVVREKIEGFTNRLDDASQPSTPAGGISVALESHLILLDWVLQNWTPYINHLRSQYSDVSTTVTHTPISRLMTDETIQALIRAKSDLKDGYSLSSTTQKKPGQDWSKLIPLSNLTRSTKNQQQAPSKPKMSRKPDISKIFKFGDLQGLHRKAATLQDALSVLDENKAVVEDMMAHFESLMEADVFQQHANVNQDEFRTFFRRAKRCIRELDARRNRLNALQAELERVESLVSATIGAIKWNLLY